MSENLFNVLAWHKSDLISVEGHVNIHYIITYSHSIFPLKNHASWIIVMIHHYIEPIVFVAPICKSLGDVFLHVGCLPKSIRWISATPSYPWTIWKNRFLDSKSRFVFQSFSFPCLSYFHERYQMIIITIMIIQYFFRITRQYNMLCYHQGPDSWKIDKLLVDKAYWCSLLKRILMKNIDLVILK